MKKSELTIKRGDKGQKIMKKPSAVPVENRNKKKRKEGDIKGAGKFDRRRKQASKKAR